jgi:hypothetical protein
MSAARWSSWLRINKLEAEVRKKNIKSELGCSRKPVATPHAEGVQLDGEYYEGRNLRDYNIVS